MAKYTLQWKDPDWCDAITGEDPRQDMTDREYEKLRQLGINEYLVISVDTDVMQAVVVRPRPRGLRGH